MMGPKLKRTEQHGRGRSDIGHWCPACNQLHAFAVDEPFRNRARWTWDGNTTKPTFNPSMNIRIGPYSDNSMKVCHYFLHGGKLQFLGDCTHALAGQTVDLPDLPASELGNNP